MQGRQLHLFATLEVLHRHVLHLHVLHLSTLIQVERPNRAGTQRGRDFC